MSFLNWKLLYVPMPMSAQDPVREIGQFAVPKDGFDFGKQYASETLTWIVTAEGHYCGFPASEAWSLQLRNPYYDFYLEAQG